MPQHAWAPPHTHVARRNATAIDATHRARFGRALAGALGQAVKQAMDAEIPVVMLHERSPERDAVEFGGHRPTTAPTGPTATSLVISSDELRRAFRPSRSVAGTFFETTPQSLIDAGLYKTIAVAYFGANKPFREVSMKLAFQARRKPSDASLPPRAPSSPVLP